MNNKFLGSFKNPAHLIGKILKVSWSEDEGTMSYQHFFVINSFTKHGSDIHFQPVSIDQGSQYIQISLFGNNEFHIALSSKDKNGKDRQEGYFYNTKKFESSYLSKGKLEIVS